MYGMSFEMDPIIITLRAVMCITWRILYELWVANGLQNRWLINNYLTFMVAVHGCAVMMDGIYHSDGM
jgi:hypothetical protein